MLQTVNMFHYRPEFMLTRRDVFLGTYISYSNSPVSPSLLRQFTTAVEVFAVVRLEPEMSR